VSPGVLVPSSGRIPADDSPGHVADVSPCFGGVPDQTSSYRWLRLAGTIFLSLVETTSRELSAGMLTAKKDLIEGAYQDCA